MCFAGTFGARTRVSLLLFACALLVLAGSQIAAAQSNNSPQLASGTILSAYTYVGSNVNGNGNGYVTDYVFSATGITLTPVGHRVTGASGSLEVNGPYVFATDGKNIVTYTRNTTTGGLHETSSVDGTAHNITPQGSAVGSITLDRSGQTLYADEINYDGTDDDAYTIWAINSDGSLTYTGATGISADYYSPLSFTQNNTYAYSYGCYFAGWEINGFIRSSNGALMSFNPNAAIPPGNGMFCPGGVAVSAMNDAVVPYVDVSQQGSNYLLAVYAINNSNGTLGLVTNSEIPTPFTAVSNLWFDPAGTYLAVAGNLGIQMYKLTSSGTLTPVGSVVDSNVAFLQVGWDDSNHLYAISSSGLYVFRSNQGALTQAPGSPLPQSQAASLAVLPAQ